MNKSQRDYAVKRATEIIKSKIPPVSTIKVPKDSDILKAMGFENITTDYPASALCTFALKYHPQFKEYRQELDKYHKECNVRTKEVARRLSEAKDFIMLGDSKEVLEYLKSLEEA